MASADRDRLLDQVLEGEGSERTNSLKNETLVNIDKYLANPKDPFTKRALNYSYWNIVAFVMKRRLAALGAKTVFEFTRAEQLALNYGYASEKVLAGVDFDQNGFNEALNSTITIEQDIKCFSVTGWLNEQLKEFMGHYEIEKLRQAHEAAVARIEEAKKRIEQILIYKKNFLVVLSKLLNSPQQFGKVYTVGDQITGFVGRYSLIKYKVQTGIPITKEERLELLNIENSIQQLRNERKEVLKSLPRHQMELNDYEDKTLAAEIELLGIITSVGKSKQELENFIESKNTISLAKKEEFFNERITLLKTMLEMVSKRNKIEPMPFLNINLRQHMPDDILRAIAKFVEADPKVFKNKKVKRFGHPIVIFAPGSGNGVYNYDLNAMIIPIFPLKDFRESLISALVLFRWDCDEEREFRDSYNSLKPYKRLSFVDLQRSLIRDYTMYITKEREGYKVFDKEIRDWFIWQVAPKKDEEKKINITQTEGGETSLDGEAALADNFDQDAGYQQDGQETTVTDAVADSSGEEPGRAVDEAVARETVPDEPQAKGFGESAWEPDDNDRSYPQEQAPVPQHPAVPSQSGLDIPADFMVIAGRSQEKEPAKQPEPQPSQPSQTFRPPETRHRMVLFEEESAAVSSASDPGFQPAASPVTAAQAPAVPVTPQFEKARAAIYEKIRSILKAENIDDKFSITPSEKPDGVNISITNVSVHSTELDLILNTLLIQSKLHKFIDLFKK